MFAPKPFDVSLACRAVSFASISACVAAFLPDLKPVERGNGPGILVEGEMSALVDPWGEEYPFLFLTILRLRLWSATAADQAVEREAPCAGEEEDQRDRGIGS